MLNYFSCHFHLVSESLFLILQTGMAPPPPQMEESSIFQPTTIHHIKIYTILIYIIVLKLGQLAAPHITIIIASNSYTLYFFKSTPFLGVEGWEEGNGKSP